MPSPDNPQSWNRYSYVLNQPIRYSDPTGHWIDEGGGFATNKKKNAGLKIVAGRRVGNSDGDGIFIPPSPEGGKETDITFSFDESLNEQFNELWADCQTHSMVGMDNCNYTVRMKEIYALAGIDLNAFPNDLRDLPDRNPLGLVIDFSDADGYYFLSVRSQTNQRFLGKLGMELHYPPNYEPVYFEALKVTYDNEWDFAEDINNYLTEEQKQAKKGIDSIWDEFFGPSSFQE